MDSSREGIGLGEHIHEILRYDVANREGAEDLYRAMRDLAARNSDVLMDAEMVPASSRQDYQNYCSLRARANLVGDGLVEEIERELGLLEAVEQGGNLYDEPEEFERDCKWWRDLSADKRYANCPEEESWYDEGGGANTDEGGGIGENVSGRNLKITGAVAKSVETEQAPKGYLFDPRSQDGKRKR